MSFSSNFPTGLHYQVINPITFEVLGGNELLDEYWNEGDTMSVVVDITSITDLGGGETHTFHYRASAVKKLKFPVGTVEVTGGNFGQIHFLSTTSIKNKLLLADGINEPISESVDSGSGVIRDALRAPLWTPDEMTSYPIDTFWFKQFHIIRNWIYYELAESTITP